jgi:adenylate cyclase
VLVKSHALVDRLVGDQVVGLYVPGFAGKDHAILAVTAALRLLEETGYRNQPWVPVGVGVHTGIAYVGSVGSSGGATDITVLGDAPNVAARLASAAAEGEVLVSAVASPKANMDIQDLEQRHLEQKGNSESVTVSVMTAEHSPTGVEQ